MKHFFSAIILCLLYPASSAQDYHCLQTGAERFFVNDKGYLKGMRIDSVITVGGASVQYPFRTPRGYYKNNQQLDTNGGSWLGKEIVIEPGGRHLIGTHWGDTVIIHTQAALNDSWMMYNDATDTFYIATVTAIDTMTVLNTLDSVKYIALEARNSTGIISTDPLHKMNIILSKNHGLVQTCDLYLFPLHEPGVIYQQGFDYFLDKSVSYTPQLTDFMFRLVDFKVPEKIEVYDHNVGDIFQTQISDGSGWAASEILRVDEISKKTLLSPTLMEYEIKRWEYTKVFINPPKHSTTPGIIMLKVDTLPLFTLALMPEETGQQEMFTFVPDDTSYCYKSPLYTRGSSYVGEGKVNTFEPCGYSYTYKTGFGQTLHAQCYDPPSKVYSEMLGYTKKDGKDCGQYIPLDVNAAAIAAGVSIYPNPASQNIHIAIPANNASITLYNAMGQVVATQQLYNKNSSIPLHYLPNGVYYIHVLSGDAVHRQPIVIAR